MQLSQSHERMAVLLVLCAVVLDVLNPVLVSGNASLSTPSLFSSNVTVNSSAAATQYHNLPNVTTTKHISATTAPVPPVSRTAPPSTEANPTQDASKDDEQKLKEDEEKRQKTALIVAGSVGGAALLIGVAIVACRHKNEPGEES